MTTPDVSVATRGVVAAALVSGAAGAAVAWAAADPAPRFAPGVAILLGAAVAVWAVRGRWAVAVGGFAALVILLSVAVGGLADLVGGRGVVVGAGRWLQIIGSATAALAGARILTRGASLPRPRLPRAEALRVRLPLQVLALLVLSAISAEDLAAYDNTTGRPLALLAGILVLGPLYGGPALLLREVARRTGRGWPSMLLLATAFGLIECGVVDQSLFTDSYRDIPDWGHALHATYVAPLGVGAYYAQSFVLGHIIYSFCAPIALVEAVQPSAARTPWLGRRGMGVVALLYLAAAALVLDDHLAHEASHASVGEVVVTLAVALALGAAAFALRPGSREERAEESRAPRVGVVVAASFVLASLQAAMPETWRGVTVAIASTAVAGFLLLRASRRRGWTLAHAAGVAAGVLLSRAVLAFSYYPVIGEVSATRKYSHNVAMLLIAVAIGVAAVRRARAD